MLINCNFFKRKNGSFAMNHKMAIKLSGFDVAEVFKNADFNKCHKHIMPISDEEELTPTYNAREADVLSLGSILFELITGQTMHDADLKYNGLSAMDKTELTKYLEQNKLKKYFTTHTLSLLCKLLEPDESKRYDTNEIIKHKWFSVYYKRYKQEIWKKSRTQAKELLEQKKKMADFPFYKYVSENNPDQ